MPAATLRRVAREGPEKSIPLRLVVLAVVLVAVAAVVTQGAVDLQTALAAFIMIPAGYYYSYTQRDKRNIVLKIALAFAMLAALGAFLSTVQRASSVDDARSALASLFIWVQIIHSFDLPRRRDLSFSVGSSLALMAEAGALSLSSGFLLFVIPYSALGGTWLYLSSRAKGASLTTPGTHLREPQTGRPPGSHASKRRFPVRTVALTSAVALAAGSALFVALPRVQGSQIVAPPFSLTNKVGVPGFNGSVVNPDLPTQSGSGGGPSQFTANAYPGFGTSIDLRARGHLSDNVVMKVRTTQAAFWRAQVYDTFNGTSWTSSNPQTRTIGVGTPTLLPPGDGPSLNVPTREVVQTFYVEQQQPNVVFAAYQPTQLYFPASTVNIDNYSSIRSPILLDSGMIYSVVSEVPQTTPFLLRRAVGPWDSAFLSQYTQLPADTPARDVALAHKITDGQPTTYDKVTAVQNWLKTHAKYNLDIAPDPPRVNAVDYFLFDRRQGFCEHFSSAMIVLLRAVGIPARFAVGYGPGQRNPFTGYYEVRESDAHSWVEVEYPGVGWVEYDPTHDVPLANPGISGTFILPQVLRAVGHFLASITPEPVKRALGTAARFVAALALLAARAWPITLALGLIAFAVLRMFRRRRGVRLRGPPPIGAAAAFAEMSSVFAARGLARSPNRTPAEYLSALVERDPLARTERERLAKIVHTFESERFGPGPVDQEARSDAIAAAGGLRDLARNAAAVTVGSNAGFT